MPGCRATRVRLALCAVGVVAACLVAPPAWLCCLLGCAVCLAARHTLPLPAAEQCPPALPAPPSKHPSPAAKVVSEEVRRKIAAREAALAAAEAAGPLSAVQIARLQYQAAQVLRPGESVAAGLKRLGGHSRRPAKRSRRGGGDERADMAADAAPDPEAKAQFNRLTEAAMKLMDAGENDVYSQNKARSWSY